MPKISFDIQFVGPKHGVECGRTLNNKIFLALDPNPPECPGKGIWRGIAPKDEATARNLARLFTQIADLYAEDAKKKALDEKSG